jgi:DNA-binding NarL/FixJ family response regulator
MIRVLIADDQKLLVDSLKSILEHDGQINVVGCAGDGRKAVELCNELLPDVVLMDIRMPVCDGIEGARLIKSVHRQTKILILTMLEDELNVHQALEGDVDGYILKDISAEDLIQVIKNVYGGFEVFSTKAYQVLRQQLNSRQEREITTAPCLNNAETNLIRLIAEGKNNKQIAASLFLSEGRVKNIITELLRKLNLKNRYELLSFAYKCKLVE